MVSRCCFLMSSSGDTMQVTGPDGRTVHTASTNDGEQFEFFAHRRGRYKFCFNNPLSAPEQVTFYIHVGHIPGIEDLARDGKHCN